MNLIDERVSFGDQLPLHLPADSLPIELGGNLKVDHGAWLRDCFRSMNNRVGDLCDVSSGPDPLFPPSVTGACQADEALETEDESEDHVSEAAPSEDDEDDVEELEEPVAIQVEAVAHRLVSRVFRLFVPVAMSILSPFFESHLSRRINTLLNVLASYSQQEPISLTPSFHQEIVNSFATVSSQSTALVEAVSSAECAAPPVCAQQESVDEPAADRTAANMVIERSASPPPPPSSASSGFSDDDSLHFDDGRGMTLDEFARHVKTKGKQGLYLEYADVKAKGTDGTFNNSR